MPDMRTPSRQDRAPREPSTPERDVAAIRAELATKSLANRILKADPFVLMRQTEVEIPF